jgi:hypothetical protein
MMKKFPFPPLILIILALAACGPASTPALSADDIRNTAVADAWIAMTMTQASIPTATLTLIPPSPTPTSTLTPFPTLPPVVPTAVPPTQAADACGQVPPIEPKGALVKVKFVNKSGGSVNLSFYMTTPNDKGECVTYTFVLGRYDEPIETVLAGCYWAYGWVTGDEPSTAQAINTMCITDPNKVPAIWISSEVISFH